VTQAGIQVANIAYSGLQQKRAVRQITTGPCGVIHDYVPFYFAPRSPMLMAINTGAVPGCAHRQEHIVHLESAVQLVSQAGLPYVFFDMHSAVALAQDYDDLAHLGQLSWDLICEQPQLDGYCKYWQSDINKPKYARRKEKRQAEFLVHQQFPLRLVTRIGVQNQKALNDVNVMLHNSGLAISTQLMPAWYY
jgi:hypothetical protein